MGDLRVSRSAAIGVITIDRPTKLNTLTREMKAAVVTALQELERDEQVRVIAITGAGEKAFSCGTYVPEMSGLTPAQAVEFLRHERKMYDAVRRCSKPTIAAVNGYALGGGCVLALSCDLRVASETATLGVTELLMGVPVPLEAALLPGLIGWGRARELILTAEPVDARTAHGMGLVNRVVQAESLWAAVEELAGKMARLDAYALKVQKEILNRWQETDLETGIDYSIQAFGLVFATEGPRANIQRFLERSSKSR